MIATDGLIPRRGVDPYAMVVMDKHEKAQIANAVRARCDTVEERAGFGADYVAGDHIFERKRWSELPGRMKSNENDLYTQLEKTRSAAEQLGLEPGLILEGPVPTSGFSQIDSMQMLQYLVGVYRMGITVAVSLDREHTAELLARLDRPGGEPDVSAVRDPEKVADDERARYLLEGLPSVGPSTALDLLEHFGSPRAVFRASAEELEEVDGVGPATAGSVIDALEGDDGR